MRFIPVSVLVLCSVVLLNAQFTEKPVYPGTMIQIEPTGMVHPSDSNFIFLSSVTTNTSTGFRSEGVYISTDGGLTFSGSDTCRGEFILNHGGDPGAVVTPAGKLVLTHLGNVFQGLYSHTSTDKGITWSSAATITSATPEDKSATIIDGFPSSPFYGRIYSCWVDLNQTPFAVNFSYSVNDGVSWSAPKTINPNPPKKSSGATAVVAADGTVYVAWAGISSTSPFNGEQIGFASSTDGGVTWSVNQAAFTCKTISGVFSQKSNIRVNGLPRLEVDNSGGARNGYVYVVTTESGSSGAGNDADIIVRYSSDKGVSWSSPFRVNQDNINNGKIQYFPAVAVDRSGAINILFYDDRNTSSDSTGVYLARSPGDLNVWNEYKVSQFNFQPKPIIGTAAGYQGDYIALLALKSALLPVWMSNSGGKYQLRYTRIPLSVLAAEKPVQEKEKVTGVQVYPNPLRSGENLYVRYPGDVTEFFVYSATGELIQKVTAEKNSVNNTTGIVNKFAAPGVYFIIPGGGGDKRVYNVPGKVVYYP